MMTAITEAVCSTDVVVGQRRVGVHGKEPTVFESLSRVFGRLVDIDPALLPRGGNQIDGDQAHAQHGAGRGAQHRRPRTLKARYDERDSGKQVAGHHADGGFESQQPAMASASAHDGAVIEPAVSRRSDLPASDALLLAQGEQQHAAESRSRRQARQRPSARRR